MKLWDRFQCWRLSICPIHLDSFGLVCNECEQDRIAKRARKRNDEFYKRQKSQWALIDKLKEKRAKEFIS